MGTFKSSLTSSVPKVETTWSPSLPPRLRILVNFRLLRKCCPARFRITVCAFGFLCPDPSFASILFLAIPAEQVYLNRLRMAARIDLQISAPISITISSQSGSSSSVSDESRSTNTSAFQSRAVVGGNGRLSVGSSYGGGPCSSEYLSRR